MKPTEQQLQEIYEEAVSAECAEKQGAEMATFDLLCKLDDAGGLAHFIRTMIDAVRAPRVFIDGDIAEGEMDGLLDTLKKMRPANIIPSPVEYPKNLPCPVLIEPGLRFGKGVATSTMLKALHRRELYNAKLEAMTPEELATHEASIDAMMDLFPKPSMTVRANGEANSYTLLKDGDWFANILMNGKMTVPQHWDFLNAIARKQ